MVLIFFHIVTLYFTTFIVKNHLKYIIHSVNKFLACKDMSKGFIKFKCPLCPIIHKFPLTCKSKFCPSCGFKYSRIWSLNIMKYILNIEHRHVLFTIPNLKNADNFSSMKETSSQSFLQPLMKSLSSAPIISPERI